MAKTAPEVTSEAVDAVSDQPEVLKADNHKEWMYIVWAGYVSEDEKREIESRFLNRRLEKQEKPDGLDDLWSVPEDAQVYFLVPSNI